MQSESQNIEYKESWRDEYLKWICGFANAQGGRLYIGVNDDKQVIGVPDYERLLEDIPNKIVTQLGIICETNLLSVNGLKYIEIVVSPHSNPINYKGQYHYRTGSTKQELKGIALNKFLEERSGTHWDQAPINGIDENALSNDAFTRFRKEAIRKHRVDDDILNDGNHALLSNLRLIDKDNRLLRSTLLLFHPDPEKFVFGAYIKIGFFNGDDDELVFQDEIHGPLMLQVDKVIELLTTKYLFYAISYNNNHRTEKLQYPEEALREAIVNAIVHKDYASGQPVQISVYPDHLVFWNPGQLPFNWTVKNLFEKHASQAFNISIANAFFRSGDIEAWGRGYRRMVKYSKEAKLLPPKVQVDNGLMVTFYNNAEFQMREMGFSDRQIQIVLYVLEHEQITNLNVQEMFKISRPTALRLLTSLDGIIELIGGKGVDSHYVMKNI